MGPARSGTKRVRRPLAATTYLVRNAGKTIPLTGVIMLAVMLIAGIVSMINSIPYSIKTIYRYSQQCLAITPRGDPSQTAGLVAQVRDGAPVPIERLMLARVSGSQVRSIVGKWPFAVVALEQSDMDYYLRRQGSRSVDGRLPRPGMPEAVVSEPVARNLGLRIGDTLLGPEKSDSYSPQEVKVVGIAQTPMWLMFTDIEYHRLNHFPPVDIALVFARNLEEQDQLDRWAVEAFKGERAQLFAYHVLEQDTNEMFNILYKILNVVIGTLVLVITFMMGMLMNIYQSQRLVEFGLLQAIGYTRRQLLTRVMRETVTVLTMGWLLGVALAYTLLVVVERVLMHPQAFALDTTDRIAFLYSIPVPFAILIVATLTVMLRFRRFDPVGVVERRLV